MLAAHRDTLVAVLSGELVYIAPGKLERPSLADIVNAKKIFSATRWAKGFASLKSEERMEIAARFLDANPDLERWLREEVGKNGTKGLDVLDRVLREKP
jgi:hypothetical protein